jgi:hypothetical protein
VSTSRSGCKLNDFDHWLATEFATRGAFTMLVILVDIGERKVMPLSSSYLNVIGTDVDWSELTVLLASSGVDWNGAAFFPVTSPAGGPLNNSAARLQLRELELQLDDDRLVLNDGHFFDKWGRRMMIEEIAVQ